MILACALALSACKERRADPTEWVVDAALPVDHLAEGELAEGPEGAFALRLPLASTVTMRFPESVHVRSSLPPDELASFVRARVTHGTEGVGTTTTTFTNVVVPAEPSRQLAIEIRPASLHTGARSEMVVKDVTPPPEPDPSATQAELRRKAGLTPDGKLLDPKQME